MVHVPGVAPGGHLHGTEKFWGSCSSLSCAGQCFCCSDQFYKSEMAIFHHVSSSSVPCASSEHVGSLAGAPGSPGGTSTRRMSWSSSAPVQVLGCFCPLCYEKWLGDAGGTVAPPDWKPLLTSLGSPIPWVSAAKQSDCGCQHQIDQGTMRLLKSAFEISFASLGWTDLYLTQNIIFFLHQLGHSITSHAGVLVS